jgi:pimeloyl-ACP methyl ester carboxylesterase
MLGSVAQEHVTVGDVTLNIASAGEGRPVVLLHGFPDRWQLWSAQLEALVGAGHHVIAPDLRGFGESDRPADVAAYAMPRLIDDVVGVLDHFGVARADVVGHDWGAGLAWQVALHQPDRVDRLAVVSVGHPAAGIRAGAEQRRLSWYMLWFLFDGVAESAFPRDDWALFRDWAWDGIEAGTDADCERQIRDLARPGALTTALNWYRANIRPDRYVIPESHRFTDMSVACPTMGVWSRADRFLGKAQMMCSEEFVDGPWRYEELPGDHWIPLHQPTACADLLVDFLA